MFVSDLIGPWKPKKKKKKGRRFPMFMGIPYAVVQSGTGEDTVGAGAGITGGMDGGGIGEELDWEPEEPAENKWVKSFRIEPADKEKGWSNFNHVASILRDAFGEHQWSIGGMISPRATNRVTVFLTKDATSDYKLLKQNGIRILFFEERVDEAKPLSIPKGVEKLPQKIMIGAGGYYVELFAVKPTKAVYKVKRILDDRAVMMTLFLTRRNIPGKGSHYILQVHGSDTDGFKYDDRTLMRLDTEFDPFKTSVIKDFMKGVLDKAGLLKD